MESVSSEVNTSVSQKIPKEKLTHFLSIPINNENVVENFIAFKNNVKLLDQRVFRDELFQKKWMLHLTLGVLSLSSDEEINSAKKALQESREIIENVKTRFNNPGDIRIHIEGVKSMTANPSACRVLYAAIESDFLQTVANEIVGHFISRGLIEKDKNQVKIHVTLMNVVFVQRNGGKPCRAMDVSRIINTFRSFDFGEVKIEEIHLSKFGTVFGRYYQNDGILNISSS